MYKLWQTSSLQQWQETAGKSKQDMPFLSDIYSYLFFVQIKKAIMLVLNFLSPLSGTDPAHDLSVNNSCLMRFFGTSPNTADLPLPGCITRTFIPVRRASRAGASGICSRRGQVQAGSLAPCSQTCAWTVFPAQLQCQGKGCNLLLYPSFLISWLSFLSAGGQSRMHSRKSTLGSSHSSVSPQLRSFTEVSLHSESLPDLNALAKGLNIIGKYKHMGYCAEEDLLL